MSRATIDNGLQIIGRIDRKTHKLSDLKDEVDNWDELSEKEKLTASRDVEPVDTETVYNVTTDALHEYFVDNLDPDNTAPEANITSSYMALGDDSASGTDTSDTELNNQTYSETVTDHADNGKELLASTFLDSTEGNINDFNEIGLFTGDPANLSNDDVFMINHATFNTITKDGTNTVTFDVTLTFSDA